LIYIILVGLVAGWAAGKIMKGGGYGVIVDILLGIAGAIFGSWVLRVKPLIALLVTWLPVMFRLMFVLAPIVVWLTFRATPFC